MLVSNPIEQQLLLSPHGGGGGGGGDGGTYKLQGQILRKSQVLPAHVKVDVWYCD